MNGTRLGRSNLMRAPLGWTVKMSPAAGAPLTSTSSRPSSPLATSVPSPLFHTSVSSPLPPFMVSLPRSPTMRSSPPPPPRTSLPSPPRMRSAPSEPLTVSTPAPPSTDSSVSAPTPAFAVTESLPPRPLTSKRSVAASNVNRPRFVRRSLTVPPATGSRVNTSPSVGAPLTSDAVVAGVAVRPVRAVALVPHQRVVAGPAVHGVVALPGDQAVVAVTAGERVVAVGAGQHVVAAVAVEPRAGELGGLGDHRDRVVAVAAVDDHRARAVGRHRLIAGHGAVPVRAAVQAARGLAVHEQPAGHRHRHIVIRAVEIERRGQPVDRRRADRRLGGGSGRGDACGQRRAKRGQDPHAFHAGSS